MENRFNRYYKEILSYYLIISNNYTNAFELPKLSAIVVHIMSKDIIPSMVALELITGQKPRRIISKHSISGFKLRKGTVVGCKVTLRGNNMYEFLDKVLTFVIPKMENHITSHLDNAGNYTLGIPDAFVFNELEEEYDKFSKFLKGLEITFITNSSDLLSGLKII